MNIIVVELVVVAVVALGLGFWQLYDVNRELRRDRDRDDGSDAESREAASVERRSDATDHDED
jgi:uncharacterized membrane protein YidH (DUF202 family)